MKSSIIRDTLKITAKPGVIGFGGGLPAPELFPAEELAECAKKVIKEKPAEVLQYSTTEGYIKLRETISERLGKYGVKCDPEQIMITGGSQQGLDLTGRVFLDTDVFVVTGVPTYLGAIQAFNAYIPKYLTLPSDDGGMTVDALEDYLKKYSPRLIYVVPTFQNPDGLTISEERRRTIVELGEKYHVPVIEDDPYSEISFEGKVPPHMQTMNPDGVILLGTFSKLLAPGFRVAWIIAPKGECFDRYVKMKQGADLQTNTLSQYIIYEYLKTGALDKHLEKVKEVYAKRKNLMVSAMHKYFPKGVKFTEPSGGLFLWVELPHGLNATALLPKAVERKVAYIPGEAFHPAGGGENTMRLNFSKSSEEEIEEGIKRLGELFAETIRV